MIHIPTTQGVGASGNWALPRKGKEAVGWGQLGLALFQRDRRTRLQNGGQAKTVPSFSELVCCVTPLCERGTGWCLETEMESRDASMVAIKDHALIPPTPCGERKERLTGMGWR